MRSNSSLLTSAAKVSLDADVSNYEAGVFQHVTGDWLQHSQCRLYPTAYQIAASRIRARYVTVTVYRNYAEQAGSDIILSNPAPEGPFTASDISFGVAHNDWAPQGYTTGFGVDITGNLAAAPAGDYKFTLRSEDGSYLWVDGALAVNNGGVHSPLSKQGSVRLSQGVHSFRVKYYNTQPGAQLALTLPAGVVYGASATPALETITDSQWCLRLDYDAGGIQASRTVVVPAVYLQAAATVTPTPIITQQPLNQTVVTGGTTQFVVVAISDLALHFQWYFNDTPIDSDNSSVLLLNSVLPVQAGSYTVGVSNGNGLTMSAAAVLTVT